ncbi:MAG: prolyl oligopeptidase family serine peptidase [Minicystis sp.]
MGSAALLLAACGGTNGGNTGGAGGNPTTSSSTGGTASSSTTGTGGAGGQSDARPPDVPVTVDLQGRTYDLKVPSGYDPTKPAPLLLELHGFSDANLTQHPWDDEENANRLAPEADMRGVFLALPHGTVDKQFNHYFWNGTDSCCDFNSTGVNDVGYLMAVIEDIKAKYNIDDKRIFAFGHSNGGFMVNRLACDQASKIAGIVSLAGGTYKDQTKCAASAPVAFLQVHGDADGTVPYAGGHPEDVAVLPVAPGAIETAQDWAKKNRCSPKADTSGMPFDIVADLDGSETIPLRFQGCEGNGATELWTMHLGPHSPDFNASWAPRVLDFLLAHPKP